MSNQLNRRIIISALLLLLGSATAWAGRGDIDPDYGTGGRLGAGSYSVMLGLPDDRLVVAEGADGGLHLRRFDANGQVDSTLGSGGEVFVPHHAAPSSFFGPDYVAAAPDGALLFAGLLFGPTSSLPDVEEVVLRVDRDGHLVTSFGGDGRYVVPLGWTLDGDAPKPMMAITVDSVGRILVAERNWTDEGGCGGPPSVERLMPSGEPDTSFGTDGTATVPDLSSCGDDIALFGARDDGSIVIGTRGEIIGLDASGALDPAFGLGGRLSQSLPSEMSRAQLLPDGGLLIVGSGSSSIVLRKFDRKGQLDPMFGDGTGTVQLDSGEAFFDVAGSRQSVSDLVLVPDARHLYLRVSILNADGTPLCVGGIARLSIDGTPDLSFGKRGLTCLDYGAFPFTLVASQRTGAPLFGLEDGNLYRLLIDATASPGIVTLKSPWPSEVRESGGDATIRVVRTAGHDGAVSTGIRWGGPLLQQQCMAGDDSVCNTTVYGASLFSDFRMTSQRIEWADGEEGDHEIAVRIVDDAVHEDNEPFRIAMWDDLQGGALAVGTSSNIITILDDDPETATGGSGNSGGSGGSGGGGSLSWVTLLAWLGLLRVRRRVFAQSV